MRRLVGAVIVTMSVFGALPLTAHAQTTSDGQLWAREPGAVSGSVHVISDIPGVPDVGSHAAAEVYVVRYDDWRWCTPGYECGQWDWRCDPDAPAVTIYPFKQSGEPLYDKTPENATGDPVRISVVPLSDALDPGDGQTRLWCVGPRTPVPQLGTPPTLDEIWRSREIIGGGPEVHLLPLGHGLTGLESPLWLTLQASHVQDFDIDIRGWRVQASVTLDRIEWRIADAATESLVATEGASPVRPDGVALGSREDPLARFRFRTKGVYRVTGTAVWRASGTISVAALGISIPVQFPSAGLTTSYDYPVDELVGVLDDTPS